MKSVAPSNFENLIVIYIHSFKFIMHLKLKGSTSYISKYLHRLSTKRTQNFRSIALVLGFPLLPLVFPKYLQTDDSICTYVTKGLSSDLKLSS